MKNKYQIRVLHRRSERGEKIVIIVRKPDGSRERYEHPDDLPEDLRKLIKPLLSKSPLQETPGTNINYSNVVPASDFQPDDEWNCRRPKRRRVVQKSDESLVIEHRWFNGCLTIFLSLILVFVLAGMLLPDGPYGYGRHRRSTDPFVKQYNLIVLPALALSLLYLLLAVLLNRTVITVTRKGLDVRHRPLPWLGNRFIPAAEIRQIFVNIQLRGLRKRRSVSLCALTRSGEVTLIGSSMFTGPLELLLYYERQIESWLGIEDWPVYETDFRWD